MKQLVKSSQNQQKVHLHYRDAFKLCIIVILLLGVLFRVVKLDHKFYWEDEVRTSLRISGYTETEIIEQVYNQNIPVKHLDKYKFPHPETSLMDTVQALMTHPEHSPLYYLMAYNWMKVWMQWFDNPVTVIRSLSVLISFLVFPSIYWLGRELFNSPFIAEISVAIVAISPLHIVYAQEARQYSLWTVAVLVSSATLLQALRLNTTRNWGVYALSLIIGLYCHLLFGLVVLAQGVYVFILHQCRLHKTVIRYCQSLLIGLIAFIPWTWVIFNAWLKSQNNLTQWGGKTSLSRLTNQWFRNINRAFFDADLGAANMIIIILAIYALYFLWRHAPKKVGLFIVAIVGISALTLMIPDLIFGSSLSTRLRYLIPSYLGIQIAFAYLFGTQMATVRTWKQRWWRICAIAIISGGVIGCMVSSPRAVTWSMDDNSDYYVKIGQVINQAPRPLVISDASPIRILTLSYRLEPKTWLQPLTTLTSATIPDNVNHVFLFKYTKHDTSRSLVDFNSTSKLVVQGQSLYLWEQLSLPNSAR
ncbi:hypothetical protein MC7420_5594 [Coleofasciculus chthonoplastes PCC 7420]|uniref:Glycosyltransferase RgtA/B/C/D-like domain-containing protein n=1 Tax=Coleofasciculus chthonoplastes PCC 7420 TaxID=118168 RepID=B4VQ26_9CYAN|nr:glycosyltransferase family 39 protein [Coleofasciculus chthonoplastes]EDX76160.1 hypothetical protein MC7420_5594 [Coleofasciculus chthonoplastes PCC 7420]